MTMKTGHGKNTIPHPQRKSGKKAARKAQQRAEAEARQAEYKSLTGLELLARWKKNQDRYLAQTQS
jgi:hypothetical protein